MNASIHLSNASQRIVLRTICYLTAKAKLLSKEIPFDNPQQPGPGKEGRYDSHSPFDVDSDQSQEKGPGHWRVTSGNHTGLAHDPVWGELSSDTTQTTYELGKMKTVLVHQPGRTSPRWAGPAEDGALTCHLCVGLVIAVLLFRLGTPTPALRPLLPKL